MKRLTIHLDMAWVRKCLKRDRLPADAISEVMNGMNAVSVLEQSPFKLKIEFEDSWVSLEQIQDVLFKSLTRQFGLTREELKSVVTISLEGEAADQSSRKEKKPEPKPEPRREDREEVIRKKRIFRDHEEETPPIMSEPEPKNPAIDQIHELKGAGQLIALCDRIKSMAPLLKNHQIPGILVRRNYLFAIDSGCGLSTSLNLFAQLLGEEGLFPVKPDGVVEEKLDPPNPREDVLKQAKDMLARVKNKVVCVDICDWTDQVASPEFRDFLMALHGNTDRAIYVFRVPYLEQETLRRITSAISDVMLIESVAFVPLTSEELQSIAARKLGSYGFTADEGGWDMFQRRLAEEKSDGRFYGINTVQKIVDEMMYQKLQAILCSGRENTVITAQDMKYLVAEERSQLSAQEQLDNMIGVEGIRKRLEEIVSQIEYARANKGVKSPAMHMQFIGNPGTGKTTVARIVGQMLKERGILSHGYFFEHAGGDFIGMYVGHTAPQTLALCRDAYGSVLFIDEAYTLADASYSNGDGFAKEAIDTLIAQMENHRDDMVIILAGYPKEMAQLMALNPGLAGRIPYVLEFPNYTREELAAIFMQMVRTGGFEAGEGLEEAARNYFLGLSDQVVLAHDFANARFARNLFERAWSKTVMRAQMDGSDPHVIRVEDFEAAAQEDAKALSAKNPKRSRMGFHVAEQ